MKDSPPPAVRLIDGCEMPAVVSLDAIRSLHQSLDLEQDRQGCLPSLEKGTEIKLSLLLRGQLTLVRLIQDREIASSVQRDEASAMPELWLCVRAAGASIAKSAPGPPTSVPAGQSEVSHERSSRVPGLTVDRLTSVNSGASRMDTAKPSSVS